MLTLGNIKQTTMRKIVYILFISICLTGCQKCKEKQPEPVVYTNVEPSQPVKEYCIFKPGTYWVYQDSTSGILDSVWVYQYTETTDTFEKPTNTFNICPVYLYRTFSSKYRSNNYIEFNTTFQIASNSNMVLESVIDSTGYIGQYVKLHSPFINNKVMSYITQDNCTFLQQIPTIQLSSITYSNVIKYKHSRDFSSYYFINYQHFENKTNTYFAPNIGMIRKELPDSNKVWNLIRYNIVQ